MRENGSCFLYLPPLSSLKDNKIRDYEIRHLLLSLESLSVSQNESWMLVIYWTRTCMLLWNAVLWYGYVVFLLFSVFISISSTSTMSTGRHLIFLHFSFNLVPIKSGMSQSRLCFFCFIKTLHQFPPTKLIHTGNSIKELGTLCSVKRKKKCHFLSTVSSALLKFGYSQVKLVYLYS